MEQRKVRVVMGREMYKLVTDKERVHTLNISGLFSLF